MAVDGPADLDAAVATPPLASGQTATYTLWVKAPAHPRLGVIVAYSQPDTSDPSLFNNLGFAASPTFCSHRYPGGFAGACTQGVLTSAVFRAGRR